VLVRCRLANLTVLPSIWDTGAQMLCPPCQHENSPGAKFRGETGNTSGATPGPVQGRRLRPSLWMGHTPL
jgi:hypothetical protein